MKRERLTLVAVLVSLYLSSGIFLFSRVRTTSRHPDELGWIASSYYYTDLLRSGNLAWTKWDAPIMGPFGGLNLHLGQWMIGVPLSLHPATTRAQFDAVYRADLTPGENLHRGVVPPPPVLLAARRASAVYGTVCCLLAFVVGYLAGNLWIGALSALLLLANPLFAGSATRAMTDIEYNPFLLALCAAALWMLTARGQKRLLGISALCGLLTGLACSVKITGIGVGSFVFLVVALYRLRVGGIGKRGPLPNIGAFAGTALLVVYALNPYFWPVAGGSSLAPAQAQSHEAALGAVASTTVDRPVAVPEHRSETAWAHLLEFPHLFPRWAHLMRFLETQPTANWHGSRFVTLHQRLFTDFANIPYEWLLLLIGSFACCLDVAASWRTRRVSRWSVVLLFFLANYLILAGYIQLNWVRYYLPTVIAGRFLVAVGVYELAAQCWFWIREGRLAKRCFLIIPN